MDEGSGEEVPRRRPALARVSVSYSSEAGCFELIVRWLACAQPQGGENRSGLKTPTRREWIARMHSLAALSLSLLLVRRDD